MTCDCIDNTNIDGGGLFTVNPIVVLSHLVLQPLYLLITTLLEYNIHTLY